MTGQTDIRKDVATNRMDTEKGRQRPLRLNGYEGLFGIRNRLLCCLAFIAKQRGKRLRLFSKVISAGMLFPSFRNARLDTFVAMKLHVSEHPRFSMNAIGHPLHTILVRLQHVRVKFHAEEVAYLL